MYHTALHLELARELAHDRVRQVPSAAASVRSRRRPLQRLRAARTQQPGPSRPRWA